MIIALTPAYALFAQGFRLVRAVSGPSGKVKGSSFVFDEVRSRFVHPQDKSLIVYFEWEGTEGTHVLSALWKRPDGRIDSISPDVKIESGTKELTCYWTYTLDPEMPPGVWSVEVRIDGHPAGSHPFEIAGTSSPNPALTAAPAPKPPTLDQIYRAVSPALVWVRKLGADGKRTDTASGFVIGKDRVATAFQAIDSATGLEIEFASGRKLATDKVLAWSRTADWAVLRADTGDITPVPTGDPKSIRVGERLIVFNVEADAKVIGGVDISGRRNADVLGERIQFSPGISLEAAGGPLLDVQGRVVAVVGGSAMPGGRFDPRHMSVNPTLGITTNNLNASTPLTAIPMQMPDSLSKLSELAASGALTAALSDMDGLIYVTTAAEMVKSASDPLPRDVCEFSKRDKQVWVISEWQKKGKVSKGMLSARVYDQQNRVRVTVDPKKMSLSSAATRSGFSFAPAPLDPGIYRVDLVWDDKAVWRTFIRIVD